MGDGRRRSEEKVRIEKSARRAYSVTSGAPRRRDASCRCGNKFSSACASLCAPHVRSRRIETTFGNSAKEAGLPAPGELLFSAWKGQLPGEQIQRGIIGKLNKSLRERRDL